MKPSTINLLIISALTFTFVTCDVIRKPQVTLGEIVDEIGPEVLDLFTSESGSKGLLDPVDDCEEPDANNIELLLYIRGSENPVRLVTKELAEVDPNKKVIVLIHGWLSGSFGYGFPKLIEAYLKRYDANVIMVDWSKYAWRAYTVSVCELPKVADIVAGVLCNLSKQRGIPLDSVHLVGHSLGAQMSGLIGQLTNEHCGESIGRITGLDPAGPIYQDKPEEERLDKSDALFVDVIHTNQFELGFVNDCGHADFYVNCGILQPGCENITHQEDLTMYSLVDVSCEHLRALDYMTESVNSNTFKSKSCLTCPTVCVADMLLAIYADMGEDCSNSTSGPYHLSTNDEPPYGKGDYDN